MTVDVFAPAQDIADAVLYEGYVLYPYRASSDKNRIRWQWGVLGPPGATDDGVGEDHRMAVDLPVCGGPGTTVQLRLRGLRVVSRIVERLDDDIPARVESVTIGDRTHVSFDDSEVVTVDCAIRLDDVPVWLTVPFVFDENESVEPIGVLDGFEYRIRRRRRAVEGTITLSTETTAPDVQVVRVGVSNETAWPGGGRDEANLRSLVGTHVLGAVVSGEFLSVVDPPDHLAAGVTGCDGHRLWPVVIGAAQQAPLVLASPVILSDQPTIAPESQGSFYDGLEIDEMLSLRVMTMTDSEKAEARATDPRSAAIVDRVDAMGPDDLASLHGAIRSKEVSGEETPWWDPGADSRFDPATDGVVVAGQPISRGSVVRLRPGKRADAHDLFYRDRVATVAAIIHDVDGSVHVAVTVDDDPAADLNDATGRYLYFAPEEIEPLGRRVDR